MAIVVAVTLSRSPLQIVGTNSYSSVASIAQLGADAPTHSRGISACQAGEVIPAGTTAIQLSLSTDLGPALNVKALSGGKLLTSGSRPAGWTGVAVVVPVKRVSGRTSGVKVCFTLGSGQGLVKIHGQPTSASRLPPAASDQTSSDSGPPPAGSTATTDDGRPLGGVIRLDYLRPAPSSWFSRASSVTYRLGLGRAWGGRWIAWLVIALMLAITSLMSWLLVRELGQEQARGEQQLHQQGKGPGHEREHAKNATRRGWVRKRLQRVPTAAWICALVACLNGASWSILTPVFQAPDEQDHVAYVQRLVEAHQLPRSIGGIYYSPELVAALIDLHTNAVGRHPTVGAISTPAEQQQLQTDLAANPGRDGNGGAGVATAEPPLYYALEAIPYGLGSGGSVLERIQLMRLLSALLGGVTALFAFLFLREALPRVRWAWTVGGLSVAMAPLLGFMSGVVQPDVLIYAICAATFFCIARAFRRGLTSKLALAIGTLTAAGFLSKFNFLGVLPGIVLGLLLVTIRTRRDGSARAGNVVGDPSDERVGNSPDERVSNRAGLRSLAFTAAIAVLPLLLELLLSVLSARSQGGPLSSAVDTSNQVGSLLDKASYVWQLYLPRLPGMSDDFPGILAARTIWFNGYVGLYGFIDTVFPVWVNNLALIPAGLIAILLVRALVIDRAALRRRLSELLTYAVMTAGVAAVVGGASYTFFIAMQGSYTEPRYFMPLVVLLGAALALAARGAGRRWGPAAGTLIVVLFFAHDIFSQLLVVARYYG
ncbi:MAG TPA: DUF2142 domain-containing protein [Solirubrobacteraceae bacterium]|nr:DUF2142 domain-containing protein [Solirubrobacteraceae bacterium]